MNVNKQIFTFSALITLAVATNGLKFQNCATDSDSDGAKEPSSVQFGSSGCSGNETVISSEVNGTVTEVPRDSSESATDANKLIGNPGGSLVNHTAPCNQDSCNGGSATVTPHVAALASFTSLALLLGRHAN